MRDFVLRNLDEKADKADFERLLSRDDLDETAQAIIAQLQDLIAKQGLNLILSFFFKLIYQLNPKPI